MNETVEPPAFDQLFTDFSDYVFSLARRITGSPNEAEDVTQETFLRVFRFRHGFRGGSLKAWMRRITLNVVFTRSRKATRTVPVEDVVLADPAPIAEDSLCDAQLGEPLETALRSLPEEFRAALLLRELEGLSYEEMAGLLEVPVGTVRSRLARGRQMLRKRMEDRA